MKLAGASGDATTAHRKALMTGRSPPRSERARDTTAEIDIAEADPGNTLLYCHRQDRSDEGLAGLILHA